MSDEAEATKPEKPKTKNLTPKQWAEIEALWEAGSTTYADLVRRYHKSVSTFERHFREHKIVKGSKADKVKAKIAAEIERAEINDAAVLAARIRETKEEHYKMAAALSRLAWAEVLQAKKDHHPLASVLNNLKALDAASTVLKKNREERFAVLGLDRVDAVDPDAIPELVISELTPEQVKKLRERDHLAIEGMTPVADPQPPTGGDPEPAADRDDDEEGV